MDIHAKATVLGQQRGVVPQRPFASAGELVPNLALVSPQVGHDRTGVVQLVAARHQTEPTARRPPDERYTIPCVLATEAWAWRRCPCSRARSRPRGLQIAAASPSDAAVRPRLPPRRARARQSLRPHRRHVPEPVPRRTAGARDIARWFPCEPVPHGQPMRKSAPARTGKIMAWRNNLETHSVVDETFLVSRAASAPGLLPSKSPGADAARLTKLQLQDAAKRFDCGILPGQAGERK